MRLSQLQGKEIVNLHNGERLGLINNTDLIFNTKTGALESILIPNQRGLFGMVGRKQELEIPWDSVVKVGSEIVIIDLPLEKF
ncbi:YlmC/YmxH family sporulation protein [Halanaerocella petrolearia]